MNKRYELNGQVGLDALSIAEGPIPSPGPGEVLVRWRAASLNYRDWMVVSGIYGMTAEQTKGLIPMSDAAGEVVSVGAGVDAWKAGDRVMGAFFQDWEQGPPTSQVGKLALGASVNGVLSQYGVLAATGLLPVPGDLSFEEAATLPCAALTAWASLFEHGNLQIGQTLLVEGTGGVSIFGLQFAKAAGARVIVTSSSDQKLDRAKALGADGTINYKTDPNWGEKALELTGGHGVDHILEVGGFGTLAQAFVAAKVGGTISLIGGLGGFAGDVELRQILGKSLNIKGIFVGSKEMFQRMNQVIAQHSIRPVVDRVFSFDQARDAYDLLLNGGHFGKIVIRID